MRSTLSKQRQHVLARELLRRGQRDRALHARIDDVVDPRPSPITDFTTVGISALSKFSSTPPPSATTSLSTRSRRRASLRSRRLRATVAVRWILIRAWKHHGLCRACGKPSLRTSAERAGPARAQIGVADRIGDLITARQIDALVDHAAAQQAADREPQADHGGEATPRAETGSFGKLHAMFSFARQRGCAAPRRRLCCRGAHRSPPSTDDRRARGCYAGEVLDRVDQRLGAADQGAGRGGIDRPVRERCAVELRVDLARQGVASGR